MTLIFIWLIIVLISMPAVNIILLVIHFIRKKGCSLKYFILIGVAFVVEILLFRWASTSPGKDGGVFGQLLLAEIVGMIAAVFQILALRKNRKILN